MRIAEQEGRPNGIPISISIFMSWQQEGRALPVGVEGYAVKVMIV